MGPGTDHGDTVSESHRPIIEHQLDVEATGALADGVEPRADWITQHEEPVGRRAALHRNAVDAVVARQSDRGVHLGNLGRCHQSTTEGVHRECEEVRSLRQLTAALQGQTGGRLVQNHKTRRVAMMSGNESQLAVNALTMLV